MAQFSTCLVRNVVISQMYGACVLRRLWGLTKSIGDGPSNGKAKKVCSECKSSSSNCTYMKKAPVSIYLYLQELFVYNLWVRNVGHQKSRFSLTFFNIQAYPHSQIRRQARTPLGQHGKPFPEGITQILP